MTRQMAAPTLRPSAICMLMKVYIPDDLAQYARSAASSALGERGYVPTFGTFQPDAEAVVIGGAPLNGDLIARLPRLSFVVRFARGRHDLSGEAAMCSSAGIRYRRVAGYSDQATAEHTIMLMLAVLRQLRRGIESSRLGQWLNRPLTEIGIYDLADLSIGIVGLGRVGTRVATLLNAFGARVLYYKPHRLTEEEEERLAVTYADLDMLITSVNVISLHAYRPEATLPILNADRIGSIRNGGVVINTGDGRDVDMGALIERLRTGDISAGLDVFPSEPWSCALPDFDNLVLTPHIGGRSRGTASRLFELVVAALDDMVSETT